MRQSIQAQLSPEGVTQPMRKQFKQELENFVAKAYEDDSKAKMEDVYLTDHTPKDKKYHTNSEEEDEQFFKYKQSVQDYNEQDSDFSADIKKSKYELGSLMQKIMDPLAGAQRL